MSRVLLVTSNKSLGQFCRKNLPAGFSLKTVARLDLKKEINAAIIIFESSALIQSTDAIIAAAAERLRARDGAVSINILIHEDHRAQAFSLFPENLQQVQGIIYYRMQNGRVSGLVGAEWRWFLDTRSRQLRQLGEGTLTLNENQLLTRRLSELRPLIRSQIRYPAFLHGKSTVILRFREQLLDLAANQPCIFIPCKNVFPVDDFIEYFAALVRPEADAPTRTIDLARLPQHLHAQAIWPQKQKGKRTEVTDSSIICIANLQNLSWRNQATLLQQIRTVRDNNTARGHLAQRYICIAQGDIQQAVKKGIFRQDLLSALRKASAEMPPLYDRPQDISFIATEYVARRDYAQLSPQVTEIAAKMLARFDLSTGYTGLFMTLDLMQDLERSKGLPVFELMNASEQSESFLAARSFLREQVEPSPDSLFTGLAGGEREALSLNYVESNYIEAVCERYGWQVTEAARHLGISRKTLYDKIRRYKLSRPLGTTPGKNRRAS
jgi:DNA-binding protein Fis